MINTNINKAVKNNHQADKPYVLDGIETLQIDEIINNSIKLLFQNHSIVTNNPFKTIISCFRRKEYERELGSVLKQSSSTQTNIISTITNFLILVIFGDTNTAGLKHLIKLISTNYILQSIEILKQINSLLNHDNSQILRSGQLEAEFIQTIDCRNCFSRKLCKPYLFSYTCTLEVLIKSSNDVTFDDILQLFIRKIYEEIFYGVESHYNDIINPNLHIIKEDNTEITYNYNIMKSDRIQVISVLKNAIHSNYVIYLDYYILRQNQMLPVMVESNFSFIEPSTSYLYVKRIYNCTHITNDNIVKCFNNHPYQTLVTGIFTNIKDAIKYRDIYLLYLKSLASIYDQSEYSYLHNMKIFPGIFTYDNLNSEQSSNQVNQTINENNNLSNTNYRNVFTIGSPMEFQYNIILLLLYYSKQSINYFSNGLIFQSFEYLCIIYSLLKPEATSLPHLIVQVSTILTGTAGHIKCIRQNIITLSNILDYVLLQITNNYIITNNIETNRNISSSRQNLMSQSKQRLVNTIDKSNSILLYNLLYDILKSIKPNIIYIRSMVNELVSHIHKSDISCMTTCLYKILNQILIYCDKLSIESISKLNIVNIISDTVLYFNIQSINNYLNQLNQSLQMIETSVSIEVIINLIQYDNSSINSEPVSISQVASNLVDNLRNITFQNRSSKLSDKNNTIESNNYFFYNIPKNLMDLFGYINSLITISNSNSNHTSTWSNIILSKTTDAIVSNGRTKNISTYLCINQEYYSKSNNTMTCLYDPTDLDLLNVYSLLVNNLIAINPVLLHENLEDNISNKPTSSLTRAMILSGGYTGMDIISSIINDKINTNELNNNHITNYLTIENIILNYLNNTDIYSLIYEIMFIACTHSTESMTAMRYSIMYNELTLGLYKSSTNYDLWFSINNAKLTDYIFKYIRSCKIKICNYSNPFCYIDLNETYNVAISPSNNSPNGSIFTLYSINRTLVIISNPKDIIRFTFLLPPIYPSSLPSPPGFKVSLIGGMSLNTCIQISRPVLSASLMSSFQCNIIESEIVIKILYDLPSNSNIASQIFGDYVERCYKYLYNSNLWQLQSILVESINKRLSYDDNILLHNQIGNKQGYSIGKVMNTESLRKSIHSMIARNGMATLEGCVAIPEFEFITSYDQIINILNSEVSNIMGVNEENVSDSFRFYADNPTTTVLQELINKSNIPKYYSPFKIRFTLLPVYSNFKSKLNQSHNESNSKDSNYVVDTTIPIERLIPLISSTIWFTRYSFNEIINACSNSGIVNCIQQCTQFNRKNYQVLFDEDYLGFSLTEAIIADSLTNSYNHIATYYRIFNSIVISFEQVILTIEGCKGIIEYIRKFDFNNINISYLIHTISWRICLSLRILLTSSQNVHLPGGCFLILKSISKIEKLLKITPVFIESALAYQEMKFLQTIAITKSYEIEIRTILSNSVTNNQLLEYFKQLLQMIKLLNHLLSNDIKQIFHSVLHLPSNDFLSSIDVTNVILGDKHSVDVLNNYKNISAIKYNEILDNMNDDINISDNSNSNDNINMINIATKLAKFRKKRNVSALPSLLEDIIEEKVIEEKEIKNREDRDIMNNNSILDHFENRNENFHFDPKDSNDYNITLSSNDEIQLFNDFSNNLSTVNLNATINKNIPDNGINDEVDDEYDNEFDIFDAISFSGSGFKLTGNTINQAVKSGSMIDVLRAVGGFNPSSYQYNQNENYNDFLPVGTAHANSTYSNTKSSSIDLFRQINNQSQTQNKSNTNNAVNSFLIDDDDDFEES